MPQDYLARFGLDTFRPHQEAVCSDVIAGHDVLLVMPTGAGKSLCYQLPALARTGVALVISPLIALMQDQADKLNSLGLRAAALHSGLNREAQRHICRLYLHQQLDYLFISPERFGVVGFTEMLAKRQLALIAVDEAHCISQWGYDFRPDYRLLKQHLPQLRPTPIIALTATATAQVQADIAAQLSVTNTGQSLKPHIHGFWRDNIAITVRHTGSKERSAQCMHLLSNPERRPAICYTISRKVADELAATLNTQFPTAAYHAGLSHERRLAIQHAFIHGDIQVICATIAFGMGIDKADIRSVIHIGLPATLAGYYQEIGRSGRDGKPAQAWLLHNGSDQRVHQWLLTRDFPAVTDMQQRLAHFPTQGISAQQWLAEQTDQLAARNDLDRLIAHGGLERNKGLIFIGDPHWYKAYAVQREQRLNQLTAMSRYTEYEQCRMQQLVHYFGDQSEQVCGHCDQCIAKIRSGVGITRTIARAVARIA